MVTGAVIVVLVAAVTILLVGYLKLYAQVRVTSLETRRIQQELRYREILEETPEPTPSVARPPLRLLKGGVLLAPLVWLRHRLQETHPIVPTAAVGAAVVLAWVTVQMPADGNGYNADPWAPPAVIPDAAVLPTGADVAQVSVEIVETEDDSATPQASDTGEDSDPTRLSPLSPVSDSSQPAPGLAPVPEPDSTPGGSDPAPEPPQEEPEPPSEPEDPPGPPDDTPPGPPDDDPDRSCLVQLDLKNPVQDLAVCVGLPRSN